MSDRQFDPDRDCCDSYYAAVADLRRRFLAGEELPEGWQPKPQPPRHDALEAGRMTRRQAGEIADEQIAWWRGHELVEWRLGEFSSMQRVAVGRAWNALTGKWRSNVTWAQVREFMIGWLMAQEAAHLKRAG